MTRAEVELALMQAVERYDNLIAAAYTTKFNTVGPIHARMRWAATLGVVSPEEHDIWRKALIVRNAILAREYTIELADVERHLAALTPVVAALAERLEQLGPDDNVVPFRR